MWAIHWALDLLVVLIPYTYPLCHFLSVAVNFSKRVARSPKTPPKRPTFSIQTKNQGLDACSYSPISSLSTASFMACRFCHVIGLVSHVKKTGCITVFHIFSRLMRPIPTCGVAGTLFTLAISMNSDHSTASFAKCLACLLFHNTWASSKFDDPLEFPHVILPCV